MVVTLMIGRIYLLDVVPLFSQCCDIGAQITRFAVFLSMVVVEPPC